MDAGVVGELGMERRGEDLALAQADHIAVHRRFDGGGRSDFGHERPADEHQREIFEHDVGRGVLRNMLARCDHDGGITGRGAEIGGGGERAKLTAVRIASHDGVKRAKVNVRIIIQLAG